MQSLSDKVISNLPHTTISNQADIDTYVAAVKAELEPLLSTSSSIIVK